MANDEQLNDQENFTHTVHCFTDRSLRKHFAGIEDATEYTNELLAKKHKVKIYDYQPLRRAIDYIAEQGPDFNLRQ